MLNVAISLENSPFLNNFVALNIALKSVHMLVIYLLFIDMLINFNNVKYSRNNGKTVKIEDGYKN
ncbi:hypothetical protein LSA03_15710 [Pediococcus argentinicus]|nr:hypothetical protein LSA03_15710 [Pediococcus argentinicus]